MSPIPWSEAATGTVWCQSAPLQYDPRCRCCCFLVQQLCKLSTEKDQLLHELRRNNHARWAETEMLQNACISLHSENIALWTEIEQRDSECSNLFFQNNALWTGSETWRNKCRNLRRDKEKLSTKLRILEVQAFQAKHCPDMKCMEQSADAESTEQVHNPDLSRSKEHVLLTAPPGSPKFQQDDPTREIAKKRRQEQGSGASLSSVSTCDSAAHGPPEEFPDASPQEELPGALRADIGEAHEGTSRAVERLDKKCDGEAYELESVAEREQAAIGLCHAPCEALHSKEVGSGASSPTESTCDSDGDGSPQELPESAPHHGCACEACDSETEIKDNEQPSIKEDLPGALRADNCEAHEGTSRAVERPEKKRERGASRGSFAADETDSSAAKVQAVDPFHPSFEALPVLLHHLSVKDMVDWRVTSRQTRSPEVLLKHLTEVGRFDTSASILAYADALDRVQALPNPLFSEAFGDDVAYRKRFQCQQWCVMLARAPTTHFAESRVRDIVLENLRHSFQYCLDPDISVREAAHAVVVNHASRGLGFVNELIAKEMLSQMRDILSTSGETERTWAHMWLCMQHLEKLLRALTKPQRQEWVCLLVKLLHSLQTASAPLAWATNQTNVIDDLKLLFRADDDPDRTYADAVQQLRALIRHPSFEGARDNLCSLFGC
ncbi:unnamed protein product [Symbiodinium sp. CCMP2592]|nr:unnamed protein product [Symbiodinium sp. CCMP2592]